MKTITFRSASLKLDEEFPIRLMRIPSHSRAEMHTHDFHELVVVLGGSGRHLTSEGNYGLSAGDVFLMRGNLAHGYEDTQHLMIVNILFLPKKLGLPMGDLGRLPGYHVLFRIEPSFRKQDQFRGRLRLNTEQLAEASKFITRLEHELTEKPPGYRFMSKSHLMYLIAFLSRSYSDTEAAERKNMFALGQVLSYIERHYGEDISVKTLTQLAAMSESSLMRAFKQVTGKSPIEYVIQLRVTKAAHLLRETDLRITDIAFRCGFNDSNYFSRQFSRVMKNSPREFRRQAAADIQS